MLPRSLPLIIVVSYCVQIEAGPFQRLHDEPRDSYDDLDDYVLPSYRRSRKKSLNDINVLKLKDTIKDIRAADRESNVNGNSNIDSDSKPATQKIQTKNSKLPGNTDFDINIEVDDEDYSYDQESNEKTSSEFIHGRRAGPRKSKVSAKAQENGKCMNNPNKQHRTYTESFKANNTSSRWVQDPKVFRTHVVREGVDITLCWIETTTIKEDRSMQPMQRLVLREYSISFENAAIIPDKYLDCPSMEGEVVMNNEKAVCNSSFNEVINEDTKISKTVNLTTYSYEGPIKVTKIRSIKCGMGVVASKDVTKWVNDSGVYRQRVEVKVSPSKLLMDDYCSSLEDCTDDELEHAETSTLSQSTTSTHRPTTSVKPTTTRAPTTHKVTSKSTTTVKPHLEPIGQGHQDHKQESKDVAKPTVPSSSNAPSKDAELYDIDEEEAQHSKPKDIPDGDEDTMKIPPAGDSSTLKKTKEQSSEFESEDEDSSQYTREEEKRGETSLKDESLISTNSKEKSHLDNFDYDEETRKSTPKRNRTALSTESLPKKINSTTAPPVPSRKSDSPPTARAAPKHQKNKTGDGLEECINCKPSELGELARAKIPCSNGKDCANSSESSSCEGCKASSNGTSTSVGDTSESESCDCSQESSEEIGTLELKIQPKMPTSPTKISGDVLNNISSTAETRRSTVAISQTKENKNGHKLALRIQVILEHIGDDKQIEKLAEVDKNLTLSENDNEHGNVTLLRQLQALNNSSNSFESFREIFNCSLLSDVYKHLIPSTNLSTSPAHRSRRRRNINCTGITYNNSSKAGVIEGCLPGIQKDVKDGLKNMVTQLSISANKTESPTQTIASSGNRNKRDVGEYSSEEISRWSKERFTRSVDGGKLHSITQLSILRDNGNN